MAGVDECDLDMLSALMDEDSSNDGTATASARDEAKLQHADDNKEADAAEDEIDEDTLAELFADSDYEDDLTAPPVEKSSNQKSSCTPNTENVGNGISDPLQPCSTASPAAAAPEKFANVFDRMAADVEGAKTTSAGESSEDKSKQDLERELKMMREKMERMQQQLMQVQGSPPAAQGTSSLAHQGTPSLAHQGTTSLAHQGTPSLAHQGTRSLAHQGTTPLASQGTTSLAHQGTTLLASQGTSSLAHQGTTSLASQGTTTLTLKSPSADPSKRAAPVYTEVAENPFFPSKSPQQTPQRRSKARGEKVAPPSGKTSRQETQGSSLVHTGESDEEMDEYGGGVVREELEGPSPEQQWGKNKPRVAHPASLSDEVIPRSKPATWKTPVNVISSNRKFLGGSTFVRKDQAKSSASEQKKENSYMDAFSKIAIVNPLVSSATMKERMMGRKMVKLSCIRGQMRGGDIEGDWVTMGVVINKTNPKTSANGKKYSIWRLSDLQDCTKVVAFFLFGDVHQHLWKTSQGSVVGFLNASFLDSKEGSDEISIKVDNWQKVMLLGQSKDLGWCKGKKKNGESCTMFVNKNVCEFCQYHMKSAYKSMSSKRTELSVSYSAPEPKKPGLKDRIRKEGFIYGGQHTHQFTGKGSQLKKKDRGTLETLGVRAQEKARGVLEETLAATSSSARFAGAASLRDLNAEEAATVKQVALKNGDFEKLLATPTSGSMNLIQHMTKKDVSKEDGGAGGGGASVKYVTPRELLSHHEREMSHRRRKGSVATATSPRGRLASVPRLGAGLRPGEELVLASSVNVRAPPLSAAKLKAIQKVRASRVTIEKRDPNSVRAREQPDTERERVEKRLNEHLNTGGATDEAPASKRARLGEVDVKSKEFQQMLNRKSAHQDTVDEAEVEQRDKYFDLLEKKETLEEKMAATMSTKCVAYTCKKCKKTTMYKPSGICKDERHPITRHDAVQKFFQCKACSRRMTTIDKYPQASCKSCGGSSYERVGMWKEKTVQLEAEKLCLRGAESKFLDSQLKS